MATKKTATAVFFYFRRWPAPTGLTQAGTDCSTLLQQIAALRGAANGLMAEVLEGHLRETFGQARGGSPGGQGAADFDADAEIDGIIRTLRTYLK